jgi:transposase
MSESDKVVRKIRAATRRHFTSEEKIRIVLEGLRGQVPISELCRREGISAANGLYILMPDKGIEPYVRASC